MIDNQQIVRQRLDCVARHEGAGSCARCVDDVAYALQGGAPGRYCGKQSLAEDYFAPWRRETGGDPVVTVDDVIAAAKRVFARGRGHARTNSGLPCGDDHASVFRVRDGEIIEEFDYLDMVRVETAAYDRTLA